LHHIAVIDEFAQHAAEALFRDLQDIEEIGDPHAGMPVHEVQDTVMRAPEADARKNFVGIADKIAIGEKQKLDQIVSRTFGAGLRLG
jgi:hypothetical protein